MTGFGKSWLFRYLIETTTFSSINWFVIIEKMIKAIRSRIVMDLLESVDPFQLSHINESLDVLDILQ